MQDFIFRKVNLVTLLEEQVKKTPEATALVVSRHGVDRRVSFVELEKLSVGVTVRLQEAGLVAGDRVLVFVPMSVELYAVLLGIFRGGMTAMFLDPSAGRAHLERCCALGNPRGLVATPKALLLRWVSGPLRRIPVVFSTGKWGGPALLQNVKDERKPAIFPVKNEDAALLTFTSGSTGEPKAAVRSHGFLLAQHRVLERSIALEAGELDLATLPVFVLANLASGVASVLPEADLRRPGEIDPGPVVAQMARLGPTRAAASPAFFERLLEVFEAHPEEARRVPMRKIFTGGAPVFPVLLERLQRVWPGAEVVAVYGSTEAEPIAHVNWREMSTEDLVRMRRGGGILAGKMVSEIELRLAADDEIQVAGGHVLQGYLEGRGDTETKIHEDGKVWHRTGDAGRLDERGRLWLLGRCNARLGDGTYPLSVECAASFFPWVRRSGCVELNGKRVLAVEVREGMEADVRSLESELAWAQLDRVVVLSRLPVDRRHNAKVDYTALRSTLMKRSGKPDTV